MHCHTKGHSCQVVCAIVFHMKQVVCVVRLMFVFQVLKVIYWSRNGVLFGELLEVRKLCKQHKAQYSLSFELEQVCPTY